MLLAQSGVSYLCKGETMSRNCCIRVIVIWKDPVHEQCRPLGKIKALHVRPLLNQSQTWHDKLSPELNSNIALVSAWVRGFIETSLYPQDKQIPKQIPACDSSSKEIQGQVLAKAHSAVYNRAGLACKASWCAAVSVSCCSNCSGPLCTCRRKCRWLQTLSCHCSSVFGAACLPAHRNKAGCCLHSTFAFVSYVLPYHGQMCICRSSWGWMQTLFGHCSICCRQPCKIALPPVIPSVSSSCYAMHSLQTDS